MQNDGFPEKPLKLQYPSSTLCVQNYIIVVIIKALDSIFEVNSHTNMQHFLHNDMKTNNETNFY